MRRPVDGRRRAALALVVVPLLVAGCQQLPAAPDTNKPPTASFFFTPVSPIYAGVTPVTFNASGARDDDGRIVSYAWNFGDGSAPLTADAPLVSHTFPDTAARCVVITYGVSLTVTDDKGATALTSLPVAVTELPAPTDLECKQ
ncbi:MAG: PKD domain-containing protein [Betaproteobacteria bacterium]